MAIKLKQYLDNNSFVLEFIWNNSDTFRHLIQNNTIHFLSEFIPNNTQNNTFSESYTRFAESISHNTFSVSYYKIILHIFSEFISKNLHRYYQKEL